MYRKTEKQENISTKALAMSSSATQSSRQQQRPSESERGVQIIIRNSSSLIVEDAYSPFALASGSSTHRNFTTATSETNNNSNSNRHSNNNYSDEGERRLPTTRTPAESLPVTPSASSTSVAPSAESNNNINSNNQLQQRQPAAATSTSIPTATSTAGVAGNNVFEPLSPIPPSTIAAVLEPLSDTLRHQLQCIPAFSYVGCMLKVAYNNHNGKKESTTTTSSSSSTSSTTIRLKGYLSNVTPDHLVLYHCNNIINNDLSSPSSLSLTQNNNSSNNNTKLDEYFSKIPHGCFLRKNIASAEPVSVTEVLPQINDDQHENENDTLQNQQQHMIALRYHKLLFENNSSTSTPSKKTGKEEEKIKALLRLDLEMFARRFLIQSSLGHLEELKRRKPRNNTSSSGGGENEQDAEDETLIFDEDIVKNYLASEMMKVLKKNHLRRNNEQEGKFHLYETLVRSVVQDFFQPTIKKRDGALYSRFAVVRTELIKNVAKVYRADSRMINLRGGSMMMMMTGNNNNNNNNNNINGANRLGHALRNFFSNSSSSLRQTLFRTIFGDIMQDAALARNNTNTTVNNNNNNNAPTNSPTSMVANPGGAGGPGQQQQQQQQQMDNTDANAFNQLFSILSYEEIRYALRERKNIWYSRASYASSFLALASSALLAYSGFTYISLSGSERILESYMYGARLVSILLGAGGLLLTCFHGWEMMLLNDLSPTGLVPWGRRLISIAMCGGLLYALIVVGGIIGPSKINLSGEEGKSRTLLDVYVTNSMTSGMCSYFGSNRCAGFDRRCSSSGEPPQARCPPTCSWNDLYLDTCQSEMEETIMILARPLMILLGIETLSYLVSTVLHLLLEYLVGQISELTRAVVDEGDDDDNRGDAGDDDEN